MSQQQPGSYQGGVYDDDEISVSWGKETVAPGGNYPPMASNCQIFTHIMAFAQISNNRILIIKGKENAEQMYV